MAEKNHGRMIPEMFLSLQSNGNPSTLFPKLGSSNTNKPYANLQLSLGGLYDAPKSTPASLTSFANPPANSVPEGSFSTEQNRFLQERMAGIKMSDEIQVFNNNPSEIEKSNKVNTMVSPTLAIPVLAAQSAFGNPALRRALNVIKSNGITSTPRGANVFRGYTSRNPYSVEGFHPQNPIGVPMETHHVNNGANYPRFSAQPKYVNLVAPANFPNLSRNFIPNQQSNTLKLVPSFNYFPNTLDQPLNRSTNGSSLVNNNSMGVPFATPNPTFPKIPYPIQTSSNAKIHNIPIIPQNTTRYIRSDIFTNNKVAQFPPISNNTNGNLFIPQSNQPFPEIINSPKPALVRHNRNPIDPPEYPSKRARRESRDSHANEDASEVQMMKKLPIVVTTGGNPNGKKVEGLLYEYGNGQDVTIVCVCHGSFFTAEEFVKHAGGGGNIENPRQYISIMDYPNNLMK